MKCMQSSPFGLQVKFRNISEANSSLIGSWFLMIL